MNKDGRRPTPDPATTGLDKVEGWVERYADIDDEKLGPIRKRVRIGRFTLKKNGGISLAPQGFSSEPQQQQA